MGRRLRRPASLGSLCCTFVSSVVKAVERINRKARRFTKMHLRRACSGDNYFFRSFKISRAAFAPEPPVKPAPGCVPEPQRYKF